MFCLHVDVLQLYHVWFLIFTTDKFIYPERLAEETGAFHTSGGGGAAVSSLRRSTLLPMQQKQCSERNPNRIKNKWELQWNQMKQTSCNE